jgi:predicted transcriptional regulator
MSQDSHADDERPGDRLDQRERRVLFALIHDPFPWTVAELQRDMGTEGRFASDAITALDAAGLVHRLLVHRPVG